MASNALSWNVTVLGASFDQYEGDRLAPDGVTWQRIFEIGTEAVHAFTDVEPRMSVAESYRVSARHTNGTVSPASASATATATRAATALLASNVSGTQFVVRYRAPAVGFARDTQWSNRFGRRYPDRARLPYDRGAKLAATLHVLDTTAGLVGPFAALRAAIDATERWALLTRSGERTFVAVDLADGQYGVPGHSTIPIIMTEIDDEPFVVVS